METFASWVRPTTSPMKALVRATPAMAATYGTRRRMAVILRSGSGRLLHAGHRETGGDARERGGLALGGARQERAHERARAHEIVEGVEKGLLVERRQHVPVAQGVHDVAREGKPLRSPLRLRAQERRDRVVDDELGSAISADRPARRRQHAEAARL